MFISLVDRSETEKLQKREERTAKRIKLERGQESLFSSSTSAKSNNDTYFDTGYDEECASDVEGASADVDSKRAVDDDVTFPLRFTRSQSQSSHSKLDFSETAIIAERYG